MWDTEQEEVVEPFRVTPGFIAFVGLMIVPVIVGLAVFIGAALVADEVKGAEASQSRFDDSNCLNCGSEDVAGWKKSLVGICPLH